MRINLVTPFAEKEQAKALGARWDGARKTWYVVDVADLKPFQRWIPDLAAAMSELPAATLSGPAAGSAPSKSVRATQPVVTTGGTLVCCACKVLPWEHCSHTQAPD